MAGDTAITEPLASKDQQISTVERSGETLTDNVEDILQQANQLKQTANADFKSKKWQSALQGYSEALGILPMQEVQDTTSSPDCQPETPNPSTSDSTQKSTQSSSVNPRISQLRSILHANTAACFLKLEDWQAAVQACERSLKDDPKYVKALHRRAQANEKIGTWASLQASLDDYNKMSTLINKSTEGLIKEEIRSGQERLPELIRLKSEQDKKEMMDKLKNLGNSVLGKFGLSTDNFKFTPNDSGGYSMSFQQ